MMTKNVFDTTLFSDASGYACGGDRELEVFGDTGEIVIRNQ